LPEAVEDVGDAVSGDSRAGVRDCEVDLRAVRRALQAHTPATRSELDRVTQQVGENLTYAGSVHFQFGQAGRQVHVQAQALLLGQRHGLRHRIGDYRLRAARGGGDGEQPALESRDVQQ